MTETRAVMEGLLTAQEAAQLLGMSYGHVRKLLASGELRGSKHGGWMWMVTREEVERFRRKRAQEEPN